jgi:hypothetical protein
MRYLFRVRGHLDPQWSNWLDGLTIEHDVDGTSRLLGEVRDQAALHGLIVRIRDMGVDLIAVQPALCPASDELSDSR